MGSLLSDLTGWNIELGNVVGSAGSQSVDTLRTGIIGGGTQAILGNTAVQNAINQNAQQTAATKLTNYILAHKNQIVLGTVAAAAIVAFAIFKKGR